MMKKKGRKKWREKIHLISMCETKKKKKNKKQKKEKKKTKNKKKDFTNPK